MEKYGTARQVTDDSVIRRMHFACCITKATNARSEYIIYFLLFHGIIGSAYAPQCYVWYSKSHIINLLSYSNILLLRKIFGLNMEAVRGGWRKLHNKKLHDLYPCSNVCKRYQCKEDEMGGS